jgi:16S rRNA (cytidine1402-2'-O)-methyltransferase
MARELTKLHEEVVRAPVEDLAETLAERELKGEVVLLVGPPAGGGDDVDEAVVARRVQGLVRSGLSTRDAVRQTAEELGAPRNEVYRIAVKNPPSAQA